MSERTKFASGIKKKMSAYSTLRSSQSCNILVVLCVFLFLFLIVTHLIKLRC